MTSETYIALLKEHLVPWFERQRITFKTTMMFIHDNASSHSAKKTGEVHILTVTVLILWTSPYE